MSNLMEHRKAISPSEFNVAFENASRRILRIEALPEYNVPADRAIFEDFASGVPLPDMAESSPMNQWFTMVKKFNDKGVQFQRLRLMPEKITPYLRYEIDWCYANAQRYGEEIRFCPVVSAPVSMQADFYVIDDVHLFYIEYDKNGGWAGFSTSTKQDLVSALLKESSMKWDSATALNKFLSEYRNKSL